MSDATSDPQQTPEPTPIEPTPPVNPPPQYGAYGQPPASPAAQGYRQGYAQQPPLQPGYPAQPPYGYPPRPPRGLSIASMVLSLAGVIVPYLGLLSAIAGVITGHMASRREPAGRGFWLTGIIVGWVVIGLYLLIGVIVAIVIAVSTSQSGSGAYGG